MVDSNIPHNNINVLLVEDDAGSRQLVRRALQSHDPSISYEISEAEDLASATRMLSERNFDNVILDLRLPDSSGLDTLRSIKETCPDVLMAAIQEIDKLDHETSLSEQEKAERVVHNGPSTEPPQWQARHGQIHCTSGETRLSD